MRFRRQRQAAQLLARSASNASALILRTGLFSLRPLRAPAFGGFVLICNKWCHLLGPARSRRRLFRCTASTREVFQELIA